MYTTIQDKGRVGFQQYGMPVAGPMDSESYLLGQALVGNVETAGALECTLLPPTLTVKGTCIVAFTGADMEPTINSVRVPRYSPFVCHDGDVISGGFSQCGVRMY
ncbi:MAG: allophanate hydrolase subunit 2 family protein, partial [Veillonella nakazawae]